MSEQSQSYGAGRPDVEAAMRRATRTSRPTRRVRQVPAARPDQPFRRARAQGARAPADTRTRGKINVGDSPVVPLAIIGTGMYLAWFGVHYWRSDVKYPTDPLKAVLQGKGLPSNAGTPTADEAAVLKAAQSEITASQGVTPGTGEANPNAVGQAVAAGDTSSNTANVNTGKLLAAAYGWGPGSTDWPYLETGWQEESGWSTTAANVPSDPYNHAYGIPQANPGTKMAAAGPDWKTSATTQITWGLSYIKATYGAPSKVPGWTPNGPAAGYVGY